MKSISVEVIFINSPHFSWWFPHLRGTSTSLWFVYTWIVLWHLYVHRFWFFLYLLRLNINLSSCGRAVFNDSVRPSFIHSYPTTFLVLVSWTSLTINILWVVVVLCIKIFRNGFVWCRLWYFVCNCLNFNSSVRSNIMCLVLDLIFSYRFSIDILEVDSLLISVKSYDVSTFFWTFFNFWWNLIFYFYVEWF